MNNDYVVMKRHFLEWCMLPPGARIPSTITALAKEYGCARETLQNWKRDPEFKRALSEHTMSYLDVDDTMEIMAALKKRAKEGRIDAIRLLRDMGCFGDDVMEPEDLTEGDMSGLSIEELEGIADVE